MKKLLYLGFTALMMLFAMPGVVRADDLTSPTFTPATGATITPKSTINFTLPDDLGELDGAFILYVENKPGVTLETTPAILQKAAMDLMGGGTGWDGNEGNTDALEYEIAIYGDLGDGLELLKPVTISTASGTVAFRARLAIIGADEDGNDIVLYSNEMTADYTVEGEVVKPTAPTFSLAEGVVEANASLTLTNGYTDIQASLHPIYYVIDGTESDFTSITNTEGIEGSNLEDYAEGDVVTIDKTMTVLAATAEIEMGTFNITWSDVISKTYTVLEQTATPTFKVGEDAATSYELAADEDAKVTVTIVAATGATVYYTIDGTNPTAETTTTGTSVEISSACTLKAIAVETGKTASAVASFEVTKAVAVPEDDEEAPALTFTPANTDSVDNNTEIMVTGVPDGYVVEYGVYATIEDAIETSYGDGAYGVDGYPTVTEDASVVKIFLINLEDPTKEYAYYRVYKVRAASDVPMPTIFGAHASLAMQFGNLYPEGEKVKIMAEDEGYTLWYTTDGSKPAINGATSTSAEDMVEITLERSAVVKAIAVKDGKASDVNTARFTLFSDATATLSLQRGWNPVDSIVGKNFPLMANLNVVESPYIIYDFPYTVYYTTDGVTEPSAEAYEKQGPNGKIRKSETTIGEWGDMTNPYVLISNEGSTTINAIAYLSVDVDDYKGMIVSKLFTYTIDSVVYGQKAPEFNLAGGEVRIGDTLRIKNLNEFDAEDEDRQSPPMIYFSLNGTLPISSDESTCHSSNSEFEDEILIIFKEDEEGTYAYIPSNERNYDGSEKFYFEGKLPIQAICYDYVAYGTGMWGQPGVLEYGSDFVEATYSIMGDFPMPVITPDGGVVVKGEEVEISAGEGLEIYYTIDGSKPEKGATATTKYEGPVVVNEALTLKAIAFKAGENGARDSVSAVAEAVFTLVPEMTVKAVGNTVKNDSIIFADGNVAFDMFIKDFTPADNIYKLNVTVWNTADEDDFPLADEFEAADSVRFVNRYYNGKYEATFALMQPDRRGGYSAAQDTTITFYVTENEEIIENCELTVKPVGVEEGEKVVFTDKNVAFDLLVENMVAGDSLAVTIYTKAEYDSMKEVEPVKMAVADSVRFSTTLDNGEYVGDFSIVRKDDRGGEMVIGEPVVINFTVQKKDNNDTTANAVQELAGVSVYPNPSEGEFNVVAPANAQVEIFNAAGMLVKRMVVPEGKAQVRLNNSGIYFVRVSANKQVAIKKVVIR